MAVLRLMTSSNLVGCTAPAVARLFAFENAADIDGRARYGSGSGAVAHQSAGLDELAIRDRSRADAGSAADRCSSTTDRDRWATNRPRIDERARRDACRCCRRALIALVLGVDVSDAEPRLGSAATALQSSVGVGLGSAGSTSTQMCAAVGTSSLAVVPAASPLSSYSERLKPVTLPPGRARLATRPSADRIGRPTRRRSGWSWSRPWRQAPQSAPAQTITATRRRTSSAA